MYFGTECPSLLYWFLMYRSGVEDLMHDFFLGVQILVLCSEMERLGTGLEHLKGTKVLCGVAAWILMPYVLQLLLLISQRMWFCFICDFLFNVLAVKRLRCPMHLMVLLLGIYTIYLILVLCLLVNLFSCLSVHSLVGSVYVITYYCGRSTVVCFGSRWSILSWHVFCSVGS